MTIRRDIRSTMPTSERKLNCYKKCDTNEDGLVSLTELKQFLARGNSADDLDNDEIKYVFELESNNGSKQLNFEEFVNIMEHPEFKFLFKNTMIKYVNCMVPRKEYHTNPEKQQKFVRRGRSISVAYQSTEGVVVTDSGVRRLSIQSAQLYETDDEDISYLNQFSCCPPPVAMIFFSILQIICFIVDESITKGSTSDGSGRTAQVLIYDPAKRHEAWRYLTYMFVHIGKLHIIVNLLVQLVLGIPLEMVHKAWRVTLVYFAGVIAGSLATSLTDPYVRLAGASGGVYALLTAHIATIILNWNEMMYPLLQMSIYSTLIICDFGTAIYDRYFLHVESAVGFTAHIGGAIAGLLVGIYILRNLRPTTFEKYLWWAAVILYVILMGSAIFVNIFATGRYPSRAT